MTDFLNKDILVANGVTTAFGGVLYPWMRVLAGGGQSEFSSVRMRGPIYDKNGVEILGGGGAGGVVDLENIGLIPDLGTGFIFKEITPAGVAQLRTLRGTLSTSVETLGDVVQIGTTSGQNGFSSLHYHNSTAPITLVPNVPQILPSDVDPIIINRGTLQVNPASDYAFRNNANAIMASIDVRIDVRVFNITTGGFLSLRLYLDGVLQDYEPGVSIGASGTFYPQLNGLWTTSNFGVNAVAQIQVVADFACDVSVDECAMLAKFLDFVD